MKHLLLEMSIVVAAAALMLLGVYLFSVERPSETHLREFDADREYDRIRIRELEENAGELAARLAESEDRIAQWERSCLAGEVPEYFQNRWESDNRGSGGAGASGSGRSSWPRTGSVRSKGNVEENDAGQGKAPGTLPGIDGTRKTGNSQTGKEKQTEKPVLKEKKYSAGLIGLYHKGRRFEDLKLILTDYDVDFEFADRSPDTMLGEDRFSIRWIGYVRIDRAGTYRFQTLSDDGVRLWIAGKPVIDNWGDHGATWNSGDIYLKEGYHSLRLDFYENGGVATIKLCWSSERFSREIIPPAYLYHDPEVEQKLKKELR